MLNTPFLRWFNHLFALQLLLIWGLGSVGVFSSGLTETLLPSVIAGGISWPLLLMLTLRPAFSSARFYWLGLLQLIACWAIFPLFKAIRIHFYTFSADHLLFTIDNILWFGKSLPERTIALQSFWLSELTSFCYFSFYFLIIGSALFFFFQRQKTIAARYFTGLMLMYSWGFLGYFSLPAAGPYMAYPQRFSYPVRGGAMTSFLTDIVNKGITGMDVFPSLHTGITLFIVSFLFKAGYRKTAGCFLPLTLGLIVATVYLHYHYGVDVILGAVLAFAVLNYTFKEREGKKWN